MIDVQSANEVKNTISQDYFLKFKEQNRWFNFHKDCLLDNLYGKLNIANCFKINCIEDISNLSESSFVIKSTIGFSSKEVLVLTKDKEAYYCFLTKKKYTLADIEDFIKNSESKVICEQYLGSLEEIIPLDYKCYMLDGIVKYVLVINRNTGIAIAKYFNPKTLQPINFNEIFAQNVYGLIEDTSPIYSNSLRDKIALVIKYAEIEVTKYINCSKTFLSLDFFVTTSNSDYKVWLGEITPKPGVLEHFKLKIETINYLYEPQLRIIQE